MKYIYFLLASIFVLNSCSSQSSETNNTQQNEAADNKVIIQNADNISEADFDVSNCYLLVVGVLQWQDSDNLEAFDATNRKDKEFCLLMKSLGVAEQNTIMILDNQATLSKIQTSVKELAAKADKNSTFIFYYAGHGIAEEDGKTYFANYDINTNECSKTGLEVSAIISAINENFKGSNVWLLADCCYSGALLDASDNLKATNVLVCTSASASNVSTGNWTYSQTLIDCLTGNKMADRDSDGKIDLSEFQKEVTDAMKYRERQVCGFRIKGYNSTFTISENTDNKVVQNSGNFKAGDYALAYYNDEWNNVRILGWAGKGYSCEFYFYSDKEVYNITEDNLKALTFKTYETGTKLMAEWEGEYYEAEVLKTENDFHFITYPGYESYYNEWVMYDRLKTGKEKQVKVLYENEWYDAEILEEKGNRYFVHYTDYDYNWDEWIEKSNIKF